jgi:hypothetical protein
VLMLGFSLYTNNGIGQHRPFFVTYASVPAIIRR